MSPDFQPLSQGAPAITLQPGEGSPAALAAARAAAAPAPQPGPPAAGAPAPLASSGPGGPGVQLQPDGTFAVTTSDGRRQLIPQAELPQIVERYSTLQARLPDLEQRARATDDLLERIGQDPRRMQQMQALIDHWNTGRALPPEPFGFRPPEQQQPVPRVSGWGIDTTDEPAATARRAAPDPAAEQLQRQIADMQRDLAALRERDQRQTAQQAAQQLEVDAKARLGAYSFLQSNPRALDFAVRQAVSLGRSDPRRGLDTIVREVAQEVQDILASQQQAMVQNARNGGPTPLSSVEGIPLGATGQTPLTADDIRQGRGAQRLAERLQAFITNRATGSQT